MIYCSIALTIKKYNLYHYFLLPLGNFAERVQQKYQSSSKIVKNIHTGNDMWLSWRSSTWLQKFDVMIIKHRAALDLVYWQINTNKL